MKNSVWTGTETSIAKYCTTSQEDFPRLDKQL